MEEINKEELLEKIRTFINTRIEPEGSGWPKVTAEDLETLSFIFKEIIDCHFSRDCDYDTPIKFEIIDRTKFESGFFMLVPHYHNLKNDREFYTRYLDAILTNVSIASQKAETAMKHLRFRESKKEIIKVSKGE